MASIFKPNSKNTGSLCSLEFGRDLRPEKRGEPVLWLKMVKQASWNGKNGSFKDNMNRPGKNINVKLNIQEASALGAALANNCADWHGSEMNIYHQAPGQDKGTAVKLAFTEKEFKGKTVKGYYLNVMSGDVKIGIGIQKATEGRMLENYINSGLNFFNVLDIRDSLKRQEEYEANQQAQSNSSEEKESSKKEEFEESPF